MNQTQIDKKLTFSNDRLSVYKFVAFANLTRGADHEDQKITARSRFIV